MINPPPPQLLNLRLARMCENAHAKRCTCRCLGQAHGTARSRLPEFFERLPESDPHRIKERSRQLPLPAPVGFESGVTKARRENPEFRMTGGDPSKPQATGGDPSNPQATGDDVVATGRGGNSGG